MTARQRLDQEMVLRGLAPTRAKAQAMIMAGEVRLNDTPADKPGTRVADADTIVVLPRRRFVSRGGEKLEGALAAFPVDPAERICADVGACTGGFTDVLLRHRAARVYAIDVGYGQLDYALRQDPRVVVMERTNARHVAALPEPVSLIVVDVSFISLRLLFPVLAAWQPPTADLITLVKPQFEAGRAEVGKGGIVKDRAVHAQVLHTVLGAAQGHGYRPAGLVASPITGADGNREFLAWYTRGREDTPPLDVAATVDALTQAPHSTDG